MRWAKWFPGLPGARSWGLFLALIPWILQAQIPNLTLVARLEPTFDLIRKKFEHSEGIYITYQLREGLKKK